MSTTRRRWGRKISAVEVLLDGVFDRTPDVLAHADALVGGDDPDLLLKLGCDLRPERLGLFATTPSIIRDHIQRLTGEPIKANLSRRYANTTFRRLTLTRRGKNRYSVDG